MFLRLILKTTYWAGRATAALMRRLRLLVSTRVHQATLSTVGRGSRFQPGVRFAQPGQVSVGEDCYFWRGCNASAEMSGAPLIIEDGVQINKDVHLDTTGGLTLGKCVLISEGVVIYTHDHGLDPRAAPRMVPKTIADGAWIGMRAVIMPQCRRIGRGAVVGAGAVVVHDVPELAIVGGNPARILGYRDDMQNDQPDPNVIDLIAART